MSIHHTHTQGDEIQINTRSISIHTHTQGDEIQITEEDDTGWWKG
jgi:hypothetical protein